MALGDDWPLVLAGPWLRRVDTTRVSVFLAFTKAQTVTVTVTLQGATVATSPATATTAVGAKLHVVVATAVPTGAAFSAGNVYEYDVSFTDADGNHDLSSVQLRNTDGVVYVNGGLPSFSLPPATITDVNLLHGSCRKAHGGSVDMLATADKLIGDTRTDPVARPHQLFLTGDQIYADDVADVLLAMLTAAGDVLLGWTEELPGPPGPKNHPADFPPGTRADVMTKTGGAGAGVTSDADVAGSHLVGFGEFCAMYLFSFSPAIWPATLATFQQAFPEKGAAYDAAHAKLVQWQNDPDPSSSQPPYVPYVGDKATYEKYLKEVTSFRDQLKKVRRALANVPTYTICDDHEVTDDWYMNREWCKRVLLQPLGRRLVRNALLSYALFQAWGNTPEQFTGGQPGETLLGKVAAAAAGGFSPADDTAAQQLLNIPAVGDVPPAEMIHAPGTLSWHYRVAVDGAPYEVLVFDSRTFRAFATATKDPPELISETGFTTQLNDFLPVPAPGTIDVTLAVVPGPIFDLPYMSELKRGEGWQPHALARLVKDNFALDYESWDGQPVAQQRLLSSLFARSTQIVALAGDVHFSFAARVSMWATKLFENEWAGARNGTLAQFTCSPLSNEDRGLTGPYGFTSGGFDRAVTDSGTVPNPIDVIGYTTPTGNAVEIGSKKDGILFWAHYRPWLVSGTPALIDLGRGLPSDAHIRVQPDFRYRVVYRPIDAQGIPARAALLQLDATQSDGAGLINAQMLLAKGGGTQVVGANALGRIRFSLNAANKLRAIQELYWRPDDTRPDADVYSRWTIELDADANPGGLP